MAIEIKEFVGFKAATKKGAAKTPKYNTNPKGQFKSTKAVSRTGKK